ncbi:hypothetical protein TSAR_004711 [Trichomalopsis sarcophagae]|uniref:Uncharacterized protein n=1 Tax=Trichomalopsis sarcophagae TaxID=543379 RepID=A0A232FLG7_9HYME|nr:hypothetical protein TSAR_004711 [Trichomalopsis sarcophagae]
MALPRLSLKRCFLYVVCITGMLLVVMNVRQKEIWHGIRPEQVQPAARTMPDAAKKISSQLKNDSCELVVMLYSRGLKHSSAAENSPKGI